MGREALRPSGGPNKCGAGLLGINPHPKAAKKLEGPALGAGEKAVFSKTLNHRLFEKDGIQGAKKMRMRKHTLFVCKRISL